MCLFPILPYFCVSVHPIKCSVCGFNQSEINIKIKDDAPCEYMKQMLAQVAGGDLSHGGITDKDIENYMNKFI